MGTVASLRDALFGAFDLSKLKRRCNMVGCAGTVAWELALSEKDSWNYSVRGVGSVFFCEGCSGAVHEKIERMQRYFSRGCIIETRVFRL